MEHSPTHALEVHTAELAHDVWRVAFRAPVGSAFDPRSHAFDFVDDQVGPVIAVDVAFLAVEMSRLIDLVSSHFFLRVEGFVTSFDVARDFPDRIKWHSHVG